MSPQNGSSRSIPMKMTHRYGLTELYSPKDKEVVHIVFVHGLFGHPFKTWSARSKPPPSSNSTNIPQNGQVPAESLDASRHEEAPLPNEVEPWPKTLLPSVIDDARIFTWGYDADVSGFLSSASQNTIHQHASNLLSDLADIRATRQDQVVPIIFVVHSLGGIIVKDALNQSSSTEGTHLKHIAPATFGVIFLGTPHRGSKSASLGKTAYRATCVATMRPNLKLLKGLEKNSETLNRVGDSFSQTFLRHDMRLYSFREERFTRKFFVFTFMVVDADSAKIGDGKEEFGSIPADHSNMTKFQSSHEIGFRRVSSQLRRWVNEIKAAYVSEDSDDCVKSLDTIETRARIREVPEAHDKTFHWLFDPTIVTFSDWLCDQRKMAKKPIYWVQGKPGSGKSTLMKFAMRDIRTIELLTTRSTDKWILAAFFFHDRGSIVQKSLTGMMQGILYSILNQLPALVAFVTPLYRDLVQSQRTNRPQWGLSVLKAALLAIIQQRRVHVQLCLFLDALDEHDERDEDNKHLSGFLEELAEKATGRNIRLKMCLASRPWTVFQQHFGDFPGFAIHEHTGPDICAYTENRLSLNQRGLQPFLSDVQLMNISRQITDKALGVFIWVRLVVDQLTKDVRDGRPFSALEDRITKMPQELRDLYTHTLRRIDLDYCEEARIMLRTTLCSLEPLSLDILMKITRHNINETIEEGTSMDSLNLQLLRLESRCGGLLEAVPKTKAGSDFERDGTSAIFRKSEDYIVQFIHQTVKEYVHKYQNHLELRDLSPPMQRQSGYVYLLNSANADWASPIRVHLLTYAKLYEESLNNNNEIEMEFAFKLLHRTARTSFYSHIERWFPLQLYQPEYDYKTVPYLFALAANLNLYVRLLDPISISDIEKAPYLLHRAAVVPNKLQCKIDHSRMIKTLVSLGFPVNQLWKPFAGRGYFFLGDKDFSVPSFKEVTPLAYVLVSKGRSKHSEETRLRIARTLLEEGADPNAVIEVHLGGEEDLRMSLLEYSVRYETASFVRLLLEYDAKITDGTAPNVLENAHTRRDQEIIQALKDHGVAVNSISNEMADHSIGSALILANFNITAPSGIPVHRVVQRGAMISIASTESLKINRPFGNERLRKSTTERSPLCNQRGSCAKRKPRQAIKEIETLLFNIAGSSTHPNHTSVQNHQVAKLLPKDQPNRPSNHFPHRKTQLKDHPFPTPPSKTHPADSSTMETRKPPHPPREFKHQRPFSAHTSQATANGPDSMPTDPRSSPLFTRTNQVSRHRTPPVRPSNFHFPQTCLRPFPIEPSIPRFRPRIKISRH